MSAAPKPSFSQHAAKRCQQRAIPPIALDLVMRFGRREKAGGGTEKVYLDQKARRELQRYVGDRFARTLDPHLDIYLVVGADERVVTAAHRIERIKRH